MNKQQQFTLVEFVKDYFRRESPIGQRKKGERAEFRNWLAESLIERGIVKRVEPEPPSLPEAA